ncbi:MAG: tetratricopeptide repeat protein [Verrucomicrobia bacterium]|jgi:tetratricopeptide (TPR) repeat protein|nr:tetratricopeptide repeat protein [Verrucomicrobiota bacterium]
MIEVSSALSESVEDRIDYFLSEAEAGRLKKARAGVEELQDAHPEASTVHFARGVIHVYEEAHEAALDAFDRVIELDPEMAEAWLNKAAAHRKLEESVPTIRALQKVVELTPPDDELHERARGQLDRMDATLREHEGMTPEAFVDAETLFFQALNHYENDEPAEAIQIIKDNPDRMPENERTLTLLGNCHRRLKEWDLARDALEEALSINPDHGTARLALTMLNADEKGMDLGEMFSETLKKIQAEEG